MALQASFTKKTFHFNFRARTSRGAMTQRDCWILKVYDDKQPDCFGLGEAAPLPGLSPELDDDFEVRFNQIVDQFNKENFKLDSFGAGKHSIAEILFQTIPDLKRMSSILFAFETALGDLVNGGTRLIYSNSFVQGTPIPINGLIWMGGMDQMLQQIEIKIQEGFNCLKLKVGGIDFERECDILQYIRRKYFKMDIMLRLDANGAFKPEEVMYKIHELSRFTIHSLEQPLKVGMPQLAEVSKNSPIPIALDEELIGQYTTDQKKELLNKICPPYIILKPSLHGGIHGCQQWIELAEKMKIGWWITSALESNIGLNAIAQFVANYDNPLHQGLGTGQIYEDNIESPLVVKKGNLAYSVDKNWGEFDF